MIKTILAATSLETAWVSDWIALDRSDEGSKPQLDKIVIQGYWAGADANDSTMELYYTLSRTEADSNSMEKASGSPVTLSASSGTFAFEVTNAGYNACRLKWSPVSVVTLSTIAIFKGHK